MDIEKLYQDVWARVFADIYAATEDLYNASKAADGAAEAAVSMYDFTKAHAVIAAKAKQS